MSEEKESELNKQNAQPQQTNGQQNNGCQQPPQQPYYQQPPQQPYYQQPPQQPYYQQPPQQPYFQQPPQQPYYQPPQQTYYAPQPAMPVKVNATFAEKEATFSTGGSIFMLILCIVGTINLITGLIGKILSLDIGGILLFALEILIVVGMWLVFVNSKKKKLSAKGVSLIRIPYVIQFVFSVIAFVVNMAIWIITLNVIGLIIGIISFIFQCICFNSVNKTLILARDINSDNSVAGRKAGYFAAIIMIISAVFELIGEIVNFVILEALKAALEAVLGDTFLSVLLGGGGAITIVVAVITFLVGICGAIVMLQFGKKVKEANS